MAKFAVEVEEVIRYYIEVEAETAEEAANEAEELFFKDKSGYEYMSDVNFDDPVELVDEAA